MATILVVDDDEFNRKTAKNLLADEYRLVFAESGSQALRYLQKHTPDLILLDIMMPGMSGFEVMEQLRFLERWASIPVIFLTGVQSVEMEIKCFEMGAADFMMKPFVPAIIRGRIRKTLELQEYRKSLEKAVSRQAERIAVQNQKIVDIQHEVIWGMANLIESRDGTTGGHIKRTRTFVKLIAGELRRRRMFPDILTEEYYELVCEAAPMHDIGKIAVPDYILKGTERLTDEEFEEMKGHAAAGGRIIRETMGRVEDSDYVSIASDMATYHHERWDGTGYPKGLKETQIPLCARIMAVADVFDALAFNRTYREAMGIDEVYQLIEEASGVHFDPDIVDAFVAVRPEVERLFEEGAFLEIRNPFE